MGPGRIKRLPKGKAVTRLMREVRPRGGLSAMRYVSLLARLVLSLWTVACDSLVQPVSVNGCPTPDEPYLYPIECQQQIDGPRISRIVFDPPGGKVPLRVRFLADAQAGLRELDNNLRIHWDLDGDSRADATTLGGDSFYFDYETCTTAHFQVWVEDDLGKVSEPLRKALFLACNEPPIITEFSTLIDLGPPGTEILFTLKAADLDAEDPDLVQGIERIEWDFDGDGAADQLTDGRPVVFPLRYTYGSVGIFRPRVRVYDENGLYTESNRLQIQILGTSTLLQQLYSVAQAHAVAAIGDLVASFYGAGVTFRRFAGDAMEELSQVPVGNAENSGAAHVGSLWLVSDVDTGGVYIWNAADATDVTATTRSPRLMERCDGGVDYSDVGAVRKDARSVGLTQALVEAEPVTVAVINRWYNPFVPIGAGEIYLMDMSRHGSVPVTENSESSCLDGNEDLIPYPRTMLLHDGAEPFVFSAQQLTAETDMIYAAIGSKGFRAYYWPAFWSNATTLPAGMTTNNPPVAAKVQSVFGLTFRAQTIGAVGSTWLTGQDLAGRALAATEVTLILPRYVDFSAPVTVSMDGWSLPVSWVSQGYLRNELRVGRSYWDSYSLDASVAEVSYRAVALVAVAEASPATTNMFLREPGFPLTMTRVNGSAAVNVADGGSSGKILFYEDWIVHAARGAVSIPANNGLFVAPVTQPHLATRIGSLTGSQISDFAIADGRLYVAAREKGIRSYDLGSLRPGQVPAVPDIAERSYLVGSAPVDMALDVSGQTLWVAEGGAGLRRYGENGNDTLSAMERSGLIHTAHAIALDGQERRIYAAGGTEIVAFDADTLSEQARRDGYNSLSCAVHRRDGTEQELALCDRQNNQSMRAWRRRSVAGGHLLGGSFQSFDTPPEVDVFALGPVNVAEPRLFASGSNGVFVYCTDRSSGSCPEAEGGLLSLPEVGISPTLFPYRSASADLLVAGARAGILSFWDFTSLPTLVGKVAMCDPDELWLPASACQTTDFDTPLDILDMDVVAPYAFLGTSWGVFGIDLRAAPILRTGSFYLGVPVHQVAARYDGNGAYVVYGGTDDGVAVFRFAQFEPAE